MPVSGFGLVDSFKNEIGQRNSHQTDLGDGSPKKMIVIDLDDPIDNQTDRVTAAISTIAIAEDDTMAKRANSSSTLNRKLAASLKSIPGSGI